MNIMRLRVYGGNYYDRISKPESNNCYENPTH